MRFGGHQTFTIRDGWLYKGLELLMDCQNTWKLTDEFAMDYLGVGRNMAKSINHWLLATGLAKKKHYISEKGRKVEKKELIPTSLAELIWSFDKYFLDLNTWWIIHINLVNNEKDAASWNWFFNNFKQERFQQERCYKDLESYEKIHSSRVPSQTTLDRDISCLLKSYSKEIPAKKKDPEDDIESPLVELGLMSAFENSGFFELNRNKKKIPFEIFIYALSKTHNFENSKEIIDIPFLDIINLENSPSKVFLLTNEDLFETLIELERYSSEINIHGMAGERMIQYKNRKSEHWLKNYYKQTVESEEEYDCK